MGREQMVLGTLAVLCAVYAAEQLIRLLRGRANTAAVRAVVMSVSCALPERVRRNNSKWALVSYKVDGIFYSPPERVQVPMTAMVGSRVTVRYYLDDPGRIAAFSWSRLGAAAIAAAVLLAAAALRW
ncbi:MAG: hypothetical protein KH230_07595 [Enterocloster asparagiformis]|nr:hypothetical protein [Enterocloster asparagiformis]